MGSTFSDGISADNYEAIFVTSHVNGSAAFGSIRNTDPANNLSCRITCTDVWGESGDLTKNLLPDQDWTWNAISTNMSPRVHPPYRDVVVEVKATTPGANGTYSQYNIDINTDI